MAKHEIITKEGKQEYRTFFEGIEGAFIIN